MANAFMKRGRKARGGVGEAAQRRELRVLAHAHDRREHGRHGREHGRLLGAHALRVLDGDANECSIKSVAPTHAASTSCLTPYVHAISRTLRTRSSRSMWRYSAMLSTLNTSGPLVII